MQHRRTSASLAALLAALLYAPGLHTPAAALQSARVTVTAYNSLPAQTDADPDIAAWGDRIEPGMQVVAVSRDLIPRGLTRHTRVRIEGLSGEYVVLDKMNARYSGRIDVFMGKDLAAARRFGRRQTQIYWLL